MTEIIPLDILMCVGKGYYTFDSFIAEAFKYGACKRIANVPTDIEVGKTRCFLIFRGEQHAETESRNAKTVLYTNSSMLPTKEENYVGAYFVIRGIEFIVRKGVDLTKEMEERDVKPISVETVNKEPERGCGLRHVGALYIVSEEDMEKLRDLTNRTDIKGQLEIINPPISYPERRFRGYRYVLGDKLLNRNPFNTWFEDVVNVRTMRAINRCVILNCTKIRDQNSGDLRLCSLHLNIYKRILESGEFSNEWEKMLFYQIYKTKKDLEDENL